MLIEVEIKKKVRTVKTLRSSVDQFRSKIDPVHNAARTNTIQSTM